MEGKVKGPLYTTLSEAVLQKLVLKPERQDLELLIEPGSKSLQWRQWEAEFILIFDDLCKKEETH